MKKILILLGCIILLLIGAMVFMLYCASSNNSYKGEYINTLKSKTPGNKALIVYQPSRSREFSDIADTIAKGLNESGYEVTLSYPGKHLSSDVKQYSILVFGSPVYMGQPSTVLTDYIKQIKDFSDKKVIAVSFGLSDEAPEFEVIQKSINSSNLSKKIKFKSKDTSNTTKAYELGLGVGKEN